MENIFLKAVFNIEYLFSIVILTFRFISFWNDSQQSEDKQKQDSTHFAS